MALFSSICFSSPILVHSLFFSFLTTFPRSTSRQFFIFRVDSILFTFSIFTSSCSSYSFLPHTPLIIFSTTSSSYSSFSIPPWPLSSCIFIWFLILSFKLSITDYNHFSSSSFLLVKSILFLPVHVVFCRICSYPLRSIRFFSISTPSCLSQSQLISFSFPMVGFILLITLQISNFPFHLFFIPSPPSFLILYYIPFLNLSRSTPSYSLLSLFIHFLPFPLLLYALSSPSPC